MEAASETLEIDAPAGKMSAAFAAPAGTGTKLPAVLVIQEEFGLNRFIRGAVRSLAEQGYVALAPDLYYRESVGEISYSDADRAIDMVMRTIALSDAPDERVKDERVVADLGAALDALRTHPRVNASRVGALGFSMGGRLAFLLGCRRPSEISAVVSYGAARMVPVLEESVALEAPLLLIFAGRDAATPRPQIDRIQAELSYRDARYEIQSYADADAGFFCDERPGHDPEAAADGRKRMQEWFARYLA
jgi:carboxymethylenebutenolidase